MNALVLAMALLALSYLSSLLRGGRGMSRIGLPSGSQWIVVGFVLGSGVLAVIDRSVQADLEPILFVAIGWLSLVIGLDYGVVRRRRLSAARVVLGLVLGGFTLAAVAAAAWWVAPRVGLALEGIDRWVLAIGLAAVASETASDAVRWVRLRGGAGGRLSELLDDVAEAKDATCIVAAGVALCARPGFALPATIPHRTLALSLLVLLTGILVGLVAAMMLSREPRAEQSWGLLLGIALLAAGTAARMRLSVAAPLFMIGLAIGMVSRHRDRLSAMIDPTRRGALVPVMLLAGARLSPALIVEHGLILAAVLAARAATLFLSGLLVAPLGGAGRGAPLVGPAMLPAGPISIMIGLSFALTQPGPVGDTVLAAAAIVTLVGELVGPFAVRALLRGAGEVVTDPSAPIAVGP